jgi:hypothetical protein
MRDGGIEMRKVLLATAMVLAFALPAAADTQVDKACDETTITNTGDETATYYVQVYEGAATHVLEPGASYMFETVDRGAHWAVWQDGPEGELIANGVFCNIVEDGGVKVPVGEVQSDPNPIIDGTDEPFESAFTDEIGSALTIIRHLSPGSGFQEF